MADLEGQNSSMDDQVPLIAEQHRAPVKRTNTPHISRSQGLPPGQSGIRHTTFNLMNTFIGAGLMSLPHAFAGLGLIAGTFMLVLFGVLSYVGQQIVIRSCHLAGWRTFTELCRHELGFWAGVGSQVSIILNNFGILVVYLIVIGDVLVGTSTKPGVLPSLVGADPGSTLFLSRWFVVLMVCIFVLMPLVLQKKLHHLAGSSTFAVSIAMLFGVFMIILSIIVRHKATAPDFSLGINSKLGGENNCSVNVVLDGAGVFLFAFVAYYNVPPLMGELKNYTATRMTIALRTAVFFTTVLYFVVSSSALLAFGNNTEEDILLDLSYQSLQRFMDPSVARVISYVVTLGYSLKIMFIYPMENWALRENVSDLLGFSQRPEGWAFYCITLGITSLALVVSLFVGSINTLVAFVGTTACTAFAFLFPIFLVRHFGLGDVYGTFICIFFGVLTAILFFHGLVAQAWNLLRGEPIYCASWSGQ